MDAIANLLKVVFTWIQSVVTDYTLSVVIFTILFKIILLPLNIAQTKSTIKMQALQPKLKDLQKKYKGDPKKLQEAQAELYKSAGANPLAGCLPMLIQLPILWAVLYIFRDVELFKNATFLGLNLASNLNAADPIYIGILFAIISGGSTFLSTWILTPKNKDKNGDASQNPMASNTTNIIMSAFFGWISWTMPAGLVIYWIVSNVLQLGIQYLLNKAIRRQMELEPSK